MKKTFTINLGGIIFHIDDDAYQLLNQYLESLKRHFSIMEDSREILNDIESRIAEILQEGLTGNRQVITTEDIDRVIRMMGRPDEFGDKKEESSHVPGEDALRPVKRLYRDPDEKVLGGVCSGIAAYFHTDPVWIRLAFIIFLLAGGASILLYLALWLVIPEATTTTEKLQMRGERVTIDNIEKSIGEELKGLKDRLGKMADGTGDTLRRTGKVTRTAFEHVMDAIIIVLKFSFRILIALTGLVLTIIGIALALGMVVMLFGMEGIMNGNGISTYGLHELFHITLDHEVTYFFFVITLLLLIGIPILMLIYGGMKMMFRFKGIRYLGLTALNLWIVGLILGLFFSFRIVNLYREHAESSQVLRIERPAADTLFIRLNDKAPMAKYMDQDVYTLFDESFAIHPSKDEMYLLPAINFTDSGDTLFELSRKDYSRGKTSRDARTRLSRISFSSSVNGDTLIIDPFVRLMYGEPWRGQSVNFYIRIPDGKYVHIDHRLKNYLRNGFYLPIGDSSATFVMKDGWLREPVDSLTR